MNKLPSGVICVLKPKGITSHDVVYKIKKLSQLKTGHTGTLDPDAEGVLPICLGSATKIAEYLTTSDKEYLVEVIFGTQTDTQDSSGKVISQLPLMTDKETVMEVISSFEGCYMQVPPMYSAIKVSGKKLYELARQGKEIVREPRAISIRFIKIEEMDYPSRAVLRVRCSKGAYMRTLCHDIGLKLNSCAHMGRLIRTQAGGLNIDNAYSVEKLTEMALNGNLSESIIPIEKLPTLELLRKIYVPVHCEKLLLNGNPLTADQFDISFEQNEKALLYTSNQDTPIAIYQYDKSRRCLKPLTMLR